MKEHITCPCCGHKYIGEQYDDCPICDWEFDGIELSENEVWDDDFAPPNPICLGKARELFAQGKNIWGEPLPKK